MVNYSPVEREFYSHMNLAPHRLAYLEWGDKDNQDILICVHGLARNCRDFDYVAKSLAQKYRIICLDVVGRGKSDWLQDHRLYNYGVYVKDIIALFAHLRITRANWLGTSMGGVIGMMLAASTPSLIKKLCLNDIGPYISKECLVRIGKYVGNNPQFANLEQAEIHVRKMLGTFGIRSDENWRYITKHSTFIDHEGNYRLSYDPKIAHIFNGEIAAVDLRDIWGRVNFESCLVLRGEESDVLLPETLDFMLKTKENITAHTFPKIGHVPALMEEDQLKVVVDWFLEK